MSCDKKMLIKDTSEAIAKLEELINQEELKIQQTIILEAPAIVAGNITSIVYDLTKLNDNLDTLKASKNHLKARLTRIEVSSALYGN